MKRYFHVLDLEGRACRRHRQGRHYKDPNVLAVPTNIGEAMKGINMDELATRWASREGGNMEPAAKRAKTADVPNPHPK